MTLGLNKPKEKIDRDIYHMRANTGLKRYLHSKEEHKNNHHCRECGYIDYDNGYCAYAFITDHDVKFKSEECKHFVDAKEIKHYYDTH